MYSMDVLERDSVSFYLELFIPGICCQIVLDYG